MLPSEELINRRKFLKAVRDVDALIPTVSDPFDRKVTDAPPPVLRHRRLRGGL
jgi:hypothetical protein